MDLWSIVSDAVTEATGERFTLKERIAVAGGCINEASCIAGARRRYFIKLNRAERADMFAAESAGLAALDACAGLRVPRPVCHGSGAGRSFLVLEYLDLGAAGRETAALLGRGLAAQHRCSQASFGWWRDNTIGSTPQPNSPSTHWPSFFRDRRLGYQLELARNKNRQRLVELGERLCANIGDFFSDYLPHPALLHGDLWGGNWSALGDGTPVLFDPAVYYGDREADLAMTELFGGFDSDFYDAYREAWPLDGGYAVRRELYNLYHVLNHDHLFGGAYAAQAERMMGRLIAHCRGD